MAAGFQDVVPSASAGASPPHCSFLPVWPSPRQPWPPPVGVSSGGGVVSSGVPTGERTFSGLSEAGGRVRRNVLVRDLDPSLFDHMDERRLEVVVDGLPLFQDAQLPTKLVLLELSTEPRH